MPPTNHATPLRPQLAATDVSFQIPLDTASLTYLLDNDDDFLQGVQDSFMSRTPTLSRANRAFEVSQETPRASMSTAIPSSSTIPSTLAHVGPRRSPRKAISKSHVLGLKNERATVGPTSPRRINITAVTSSLPSSSTFTSPSTVQYPASSPPPAIQAAPDFSQPLARLHQLFHKDDWDNYARGDRVLSTSAKGKGLVKAGKKRHPAFANNSNHDSVDFTANGSNPPKKKRTGSSSAHAPSRKRDTTTSATAVHDLSESNDMTDTAAQYRGDSVKKQNVSAPIEASHSPDNNDDKRFAPSESPTRARSSTTEPDLVIDRHNDENKLGLGPIQEHKRNNDGVGQSSASSLSPQRPACVPTNHDAELPPANSPSEEQHSFSATLVVNRENERGPTDGIRTINSVTAADIAHASTTTIASRDVYHRDDGGQRKPKKVNRVVTVDISKNPSRKRPASLSKRDLQEGRKMHGWRNGRSQTMDLHSVVPPVEDVHSGCDTSAGPNLPSGDVHEFPNVCLTDDITGTARHGHSTNYTTRSHIMIDIESPSPLADATVTNGIHTLALEDYSPSPPDEQSPGSCVKGKTNEPPQNMLDPSSSRTRRASHASVSASRKRSSSSREDPMIDGRVIKKRKTTRDGGHGGAVATARIPVRPKSAANLNDEGPRTVSSRPNVNRRNPMPAVKKMRTRQENAPKGITRTGAKTSASGVPKEKRGVAGKTLEKRKHVAVRPLRPVSIARPTMRKATSSKGSVSKTSPRTQPSCPSSRLNARSQEGQQKNEKLQHLGKELVIDSGVQSIVDMKEGEGGDRTVRLGCDHGPEHLPPALHVATSGSTLAGSGSPPSRSQAVAGQIEDVTPDLEYVRPRTRSMTKTTKPVAFSFHTNRRAQERAKFDEIIKAKEAELQRIKEAERLVREEQERKEIKELRMRMIPKAHEVPEWYAHAPRRRPRESTEDNPAVRGAIAATHGRTAGGKAR